MGAISQSVSAFQQLGIEAASVAGACGQLLDLPDVATLSSATTVAVPSVADVATSFTPGTCLSDFVTAGGQAGQCMPSTAMRVVNAIPYVVDAEPGLLSSLDLAMTLPRNAFT